MTSLGSVAGSYLRGQIVLFLSLCSSTTKPHNRQQYPCQLRVPESGVVELSRWLTVDSEELKKMKVYFVPFAKGSRNSLGQKKIDYIMLVDFVAEICFEATDF